ITLNTVDLPAPFGPISAKISRSRTSKLRSLSAASPPKLIERSSTPSTALLGLEPVRHRLEASLLDAHPEPLLLRLLVGNDRARRQDSALESLDRLERRHQRLTRQAATGALGAFREEHRCEVAGDRVPVDLVGRVVALHVFPVELDARQIRAERIRPQR